MSNITNDLEALVHKMDTLSDKIEALWLIYGGNEARMSTLLRSVLDDARALEEELENARVVIAEQEREIQAITGKGEPK